MNRPTSAAALRDRRTRPSQADVVEAVFAGSVSCLVILDREFNYIRVNQAYASACDRQIEDFTGRNHFDMYPSKAKAIFESVVRTKHSQRFEGRPFRSHDNPARGVSYWDWTLTPVLGDDDDVAYLIFSLNDVTAHKRAEQQLLDSEAQLRDLAASLHTQLESERARIARELHDRLGQMLTALKLHAVRASHDLPPEPFGLAMRAHLHELGLSIDNAINDVRELTTWLRPAALDIFGLVAAVCAETPRLAAHSRVKCVLRCDADVAGLTPDQETAAFRIVQEAMTNVMRHADASLAVVVVKQRGDQVIAAVFDNGRGISSTAAQNRASLGLAGMRERAMLTGGTFDIQRRRVRGTRVVVTLPRHRATKSTRATKPT